MIYDIPPQWQQPLTAIAQSTGRSLEAVMAEAIALYLARCNPLPPSMAVGLEYEDIENEADEVLLAFLNGEATPHILPAKNPPVMGLEDGDDEPYEILTGFLEP